MKLNISEMTLKNKLIASFAVVLFVQIITGLSFSYKIKRMDNEMSGIVDQVQPVMVMTEELGKNLTNMTLQLGLYMLEHKEYHIKEFDQFNLQLISNIESLKQSDIVKNSTTMQSKLQAITNETKHFTEFRQTSLELVADRGKNMPATQYASDSVNPLAMEISQILSGMIQVEEDEPATPERKTLLFALNKLRYDWSNVINEMRLYLAFRTPNARQNMLMFRDSVVDRIETVNNLQDILTFEQLDGIENAASKFGEYIVNTNKLIEIQESEKWRMDAWTIKNRIDPMLKALNNNLSSFLDEIKAISQNANDRAKALAIRGHYETIFSIIAGVLLLSLLGWLLIRNIQCALGTDPRQLQKITDAIASGDFNSRLDIAQPKGVYASVLSMQQHLKDSIEKELSLAKINSRVKQALDTVTTDVMIADENLDIIYVNQAAQEMMHFVEKDLRKTIPDFDASKIVGMNIDTFHKNPSHQQQLLEGLDSTHRAIFPIGSRTVQSVITPVKNSDGRRIGTVIEMTDRTDEQAIENELQDIINYSRNGDLSHRVDLDDKTGFFARMAEGINEMVDVCDRIISETVSVIGFMARGDLTHEIKADYSGSFGQLKTDVNVTISKLTEVMTEIRNNADQVMTGAQEISQGNNNLSQRTEQQASSLEQTASSMEQMTSTVRKNADNAHKANQLAASARNQAGEGGAVVGNAVSAMNEITQSSNKIAAIIGVIDEIAFQTNLLALNAAVEAARAGEQGRGFAVVASEVRNLAGRSATAAKEIKDLIEDTVFKIEEGSKLVDDSGKTLEEIVLSVQKVNDIIADIASASQDQSEGIDQVNKSIAQMDEMTQQNAALVEEAASASESMSEQAGSLNQLVSFFKTGNDASSFITERRKSDRPWQTSTNKPDNNTSTQANTENSVSKSIAIGDVDDQWEEF